jgi:D-beta-D-heptose 7-phosphate kinase/D-beta-D-heptose 1-phosphate adenosyltransferase
VQNEVSVAGGAGNVVLNLLSLGAEVVAVGRVGHDIAGEKIISSLESEGARIEGILHQENYHTPVKNRLIADSQQVLRVDFETVTPTPKELEEALINKLDDLMADCKIVAVSDYGKGLLSPRLIQTVVERAKRLNIPVIIDPKGVDFNKYHGATILKPNLGEAYAAAKLPAETPLDEVAAAILETSGVNQLFITRSREGISLFNQGGERFDFPVRSKEVKDVTGAGDTVLAMLSLALANGLDIKYGAQLANIAAGMVIERIGCARINLSDMAERLLEFDVENKIFDGEHIRSLQQSLKGRRCQILSLQSNHGMSTALFKSIRELSSKDPEVKLVAYVRDSGFDREFISLLSSLSEVDFIVVECHSLEHICEMVEPEEVFAIEASKLVDLDRTPAQLVTL